jgi:hypothetical protein
MFASVHVGGLTNGEEGRGTPGKSSFYAGGGPFSRCSVTYAERSYDRGAMSLRTGLLIVAFVMVLLVVWLALQTLGGSGTKG